MCEKNALSSCRPTGRLDPTPVDLASASLALAALESQVRRGESIFLDEDETEPVTRCPAPAGLVAPRPALSAASPSTAPQSHQTGRGAQTPGRGALSHLEPPHPRGWLSVVGAVQYGTSRVCETIVPHFDAHEFRHYTHHGGAIFGPAGTEVVMVVDRSGIQRAGQLASTLEHYEGQLQCHLFPAHCGHHLNPIAGFWCVMKDAIGAGRGCRDLPELYTRTRQVLMAQQERPISEFHWCHISPRTSQELLFDTACHPVTQAGVLSQLVTSPLL